MGKLKTSHISDGGMSKSLKPGSNVVKINKVYLDRPEQATFMVRDKGYYFKYDVETKPIPGFEGFLIDLNNPEGPRYAGQIGTVKSMFPKFFYADRLLPNGNTISRNDKILQEIRKICIATKSLDWFKENDEKHDDIESYVEAFNNDAPFKDKWLNVTIAGVGYLNKQGYTAYELYFPSSKTGGYAYELEGTTPSNLIPFDPELHQEEPTNNAVDSNAGDSPVDPIDSLEIDTGLEAPDFDL